MNISEESNKKMQNSISYTTDQNFNLLVIQRSQCNFDKKMIQIEQEKH